MAIEAVLFDYSGLLTTSLQLPTENMPYDPDALLAEMIAALASPEPNPWHELERGEISLDDYCAYAEAKVPGASVLFHAESQHNVMAALELIEDRVATVRELEQQGMRVGLVTNNVAEWRPFWFPRLPPGLFEIVIDSAEVGHRKPEAAIYELAVANLGIADPAAVLFVDDFEWNVVGARSVGMAGLHCTAGMDMRSAVAACLGPGE